MDYPLLERVVDLLSNETCIICQNTNTTLCEACFTSTIADPVSRCYICNKLTKSSRTCSSCSSRLRRVWWLGSYEEPLKTLIWQMKFQRKRSNARLFGYFLSQFLPQIDSAVLVTSAPTAASRIRRRGFDQAQLTAKSFAKERGLEYKSLLERISQVDLIGKTRTQRRSAMKQSMCLRRKVDVTGLTILLIDDVLTTGATLEAAAGILRDAGARHIDAAVVARRIR